jgi:type VI secretion system protein VasG
MVGISRNALFGKLNQVGYRAIEAATVSCKMRGNAYVELVHWIHQILQLADSDMHRIVKQFNLEPSHLAANITEALERLPRGSTTISDLSGDVEQAVERGWVIATLMFGESQVRTGHLIAGILQSRGLRNVLLGISREFEKVTFEKLSERFDEIVGNSPENHMHAHDGFQVGGGAAPGETSGALAPAPLGRQQALRQFTVDLTERARNGEMDPIVGRDEEIRQMIDILMRRRQNNPMLTGEAGVGKTAVVEAFTQRVAAGNVPPPLRGVVLRELDVGLLQAGASMKGEFENRLKQVIEEVQSSEKPIILFIDEAHTLIGAGGAAGTGDAANLLKPALARGTLRTIGATTWAEYKRHIEKDPALTRRFQVIRIDEPSETLAIRIMRATVATMEKHHHVRVLDEALRAAVKLSSRYIQGRQLPDKCVSLLDTACARVAISQYTVPALVEASRNRIAALEQEQRIIARERTLMIGAGDQGDTVEATLAGERERLTALESRWHREAELVTEIVAARERLGFADLGENGTVGTTAAGDNADPERTGLAVRLGDLQRELTELQGETPLVLPLVDEQAIASVVADWTGIPVGRMVQDEVQAILHLADRLKERIVGQDHALEMIARRIRTSRANLDNPGKPIGVFMLAGSSGVGKTETALALADALYGGEHNIITLNMSEYQEAHTVSTLKGAPPGYVGYGEGGVLTEAVRRSPFSVVLLDEIEKAHPDVHEIFFQVFDKGWMEDGEGRVIDFKNTLIILTTNVGTETIMSLHADPELIPGPDVIARSLREPLLKVFPAALLGRLVVIPYYPLSDEMIVAISKLQLGKIERRLADNHRVPFSYDEEVIDLIASRCTDIDSGGRMIDAILTNTVLPEISEEILTRMMAGRSISRVHVGVGAGEFCYDYD